MNRRLVACVLLLLLSLQSVTAVAAFGADKSDDRAVMAQMSADCVDDCCSGTCDSTAACAVYCAAYSTTFGFVQSFFVDTAIQQTTFAARVTFAPTLPPIKPPPDSLM
jgi:hypothetical protein